MSQSIKKRIRKAVYCCASGFPYNMAQLPAVRVRVQGVEMKGLVDTGCSRTIVSIDDVRTTEVKTGSVRVTMMDGSSTTCCKSSIVKIEVGGVEITLDCLVSKLLPGFGVLLGMDAVSALGGVHVSPEGHASFEKTGRAVCSPAVDLSQQRDIQIVDDDFRASYSRGFWEVEWFWKENEPTLVNRVPQYKVAPDIQAEFDATVEQWIARGWLRPYDGVCKGMLPLMAVVQPNKHKVRPVLDYREMNQFVPSHTGESEVCSDKLRGWRQKGIKLKLVDLRDAYLQIHVSPQLWPYQVVKFKGRTFCLTRLGFGLNIAPKVMAKIVNAVLSSDPQVRAGADSYVDDIVVNEEVVPCERVLEVLEEHGLDAKPPEELVGARVLGLRIQNKGGDVEWKRDNNVNPVEETMSRAEVFSMCGQLVAHFPVAGWLRPACGYIKRCASVGSWKDPVDAKVVKMLREVRTEIERRDPVKGRWAVAGGGACKVWCDASSLAVGACLEVDGDVIEDASWLRKPDDVAHINLAELDSVVKGINLALKWGKTQLEVITDSTTVYTWMRSLLTHDKRITTHGLAEALVKRRLALIDDLMKECGLDITVRRVNSHENKADQLTRVPKAWLSMKPIDVSMAASAQETKEGPEEAVRRIHELNHFGVRRTLFLARLACPKTLISKSDVSAVIRNCRQCQSIDPAPVKWKEGKLSVKRVWQRLACDVTHYEGSLYLTLIDCGPSRFTIWKHLKNESSQAVCEQLRITFCEMGPPAEILVDNGAAFRAQTFQALCMKWGVQIIYRCAHRPSGNGIVERIHRTVKRMAARAKGDPVEMAFWYNLAPLNNKAGSAPSARLFRNWWRYPTAPIPGPGQSSNDDDDLFNIGDKVVVKPSQTVPCTSSWRSATVTGKGRDSTSVEIDGLPRHIADVRRLPPASDQPVLAEHGPTSPRPQRARRPPQHLNDYVLE